MIFFFSISVALLGFHQFFVRRELASRCDRAGGDIFVLSSRDDALQSRPGPKGDESGSGKRSQTTSRRTGAHRTLQPLFRAPTYLSHGADCAFAHVALRRRIIFPRRAQSRRAQSGICRRGRSGHRIRFQPDEKRPADVASVDIRDGRTRAGIAGCKAAAVGTMLPYGNFTNTRRIIRAKDTMPNDPKAPDPGASALYTAITPAISTPLA